MTVPRIRRARPADLPRLAELERGAFTAAWREADLAEGLASPAGVTLVAESGVGRLLGFALFLRGLDDAELLRVAVEPPARRLGIGKALVEEGLRRLGAAGVTRCLLEVRPSNAAARGLYEALGFHVAGRRRGYYTDGEDALVYEREGTFPG